MHLPDLHIHTVYSDGIDSPAEIVREAGYRELPIIGLTDHFDEVSEYCSFSQYLNDISKAKGTSLCKVLTSIEVDVPDSDAFVREYKQNPSYDYVVFHDIADLNEINLINETSKHISIPFVLGHLPIKKLGTAKEVAQEILKTKLIPEISQLHFSYLSKSELKIESEFFSYFIHSNRPISFGTDSTDSKTIGIYSEEIKKFAEKAKIFISDSATPVKGNILLDPVVQSIGKSNQVWFSLKQKLPIQDNSVYNLFLGVKELIREGDSKLFLGFEQQALATVINKLNNPQVLSGEKRAALEALEFFFRNCPSLRTRIFSQLGVSIGDPIKHVRRWTMDTLVNIYQVDKIYQPKILKLLDERLSDNRPAIVKAAERMIKAIQLQSRKHQ